MDVCLFVLGRSAVLDSLQEIATTLSREDARADLAEPSSEDLKLIGCHTLALDVKVMNRQASRNGFVKSNDVLRLYKFVKLLFAFAIRLV